MTREEIQNLEFKIALYFKQYKSNPDKPELKRFEDRKIDHESTKIRRHEILNVVFFVLSTFRVFVIVFQNFLPEKMPK